VNPPTSGDLPVVAGRWQFDPDDQLGSGANAETFGGTDLETGDGIVVKLFRGAAGQRGRERFLREARLHEKLVDAAILPLLDADRDPEYGDFIVTLRLRPGSLWEAAEAARRFPLSTSDTLAIANRIAGALSYMHGRGEIHGDISPGNILLDANGESYLADFGFSKRMASIPIVSSTDRFGTKGFAAPRLLDTPRTPADDVYSLAAVLWFCLTGRAPSPLASVRRRELKSRALRAPLDRVLEWDPDRTPAAEEFAASLRRGWAAATDDWRQAASRRQRSLKGAAAAAAAAAIAAAGIAGHVFAPEPAAGSAAVVARAGLELHLPRGWRQRRPPQVSALELRRPVAAGKGRTLVVAGRAPTSGTGLISAKARRALPEAARQPTAVAIGDQGALRYGPATRFGGAIEVLVMPLERDTLVFRCSGPVGALAAICSRAVDDAKLSRGAVQPLAPDAVLARELRAEVKRLDNSRRRLHNRLAASTSSREAAAAARKLERLEGGFAARLGAKKTNAQDRPAIQAATHSAQAAANSYGRLSKASATGWDAARAAVLRNESRLANSVRRLGRLKVYGSQGSLSSSERRARR
jgi:hypothetical protein